MYRLMLPGLLVLLFAVQAQAAEPAPEGETPQQRDETPQEQSDGPIIVDGLEMVNWFCSSANEVKVVFREHKFNSRRGRLNVTLTTSKGVKLSNSQAFTISRNSPNDKSVTLLRYRPNLKGQLAKVEIMIDDDRGDPSFWFEVTLQ